MATICRSVFYPKIFINTGYGVRFLLVVPEIRVQTNIQSLELYNSKIMLPIFLILDRLWFDHIPINSSL